MFTENAFSKNTLSRNRALKLTTFPLAILILALLPVGAFAMGPPPPPGVDHDVIIVGAGAAGQYAAFELNNLGFDVLVLEGSDRRHGRLESRTLGGVTTQVHAEGVTGNKQVNWNFHDIQNLDKNRLLKYFLYSPSDDTLTSVGGIAVDSAPGTKEFPGNVIYDYWDFYYSGEDYKGPDIDAETYICDTLGVCREGSPNFTNSESDKAFHLYVGSFPGADYTTSLDRLGMRSLAEQETLWNAGLGEWAHVTGTWQDTLDELYFNTILSNVQLNSLVNAIDTSGANVAVTHSNNKTVTANAVVVTVSLGILKAGDITFTPALPQVKQDAITNIGFGTGGKMMLQFTSVPSPGDFHSWFTEGPAGLCWNYFFRQDEPNGANVLTCFVTGELGETMDALFPGNESAQLAQAVADLDAICPKPGTAPGCLFDETGTRLTPWADAFVAGFYHRGEDDLGHKGAYSYPSIGSYPTDGSPSQREDLADQVGTKLYFAGEATSNRYSATVFGALDSGLRVAGEVDADHNPGGP